MRIHVLGLQHTATTKAYNACAFTQKVYTLCQMLHNLVLCQKQNSIGSAVLSVST